MIRLFTTCHRNKYVKYSTPTEKSQEEASNSETQHSTASTEEMDGAIIEMLSSTIAGVKDDIKNEVHTEASTMFVVNQIEKIKQKVREQKSAKERFNEED